MEDKQVPARPQARYRPQPLATKKAVQQAERVILEAVQMVDAAMHRHATRVIDKEQIAMSNICKSAEFKARVKTFRNGILSEEANMAPTSEIGKDTTSGYTEQQVNDFKAKLQQDMRDTQAQRSAKKLQKSPHSNRSSFPIEGYSAARNLSTSRSRKSCKAPRRLSQSRPIKKVQNLTTDVDGMIAIELNPTGFAQFPQHHEDDADWDRVSQCSLPKPEEGPNAYGEVAGLKELFRGWSGK